MGIAKEKEKSHDMAILMKDISKLTGHERELALKVNDEIAKQYNM